MAFEWFISFIVFLIIEALTVNLVTIWFAIGALASTISCLFTDSIIIQATVFVIVSVLSLFATQPLIRKFRKTSVIPTNFDRVIGKIGVVTKKIGLKQLEKNHVVPPSSQDEALSRYSVSGQVPR